MRSLKNYLSFILALVAILFSIQFSILSNNIVREYERLINSDYNVILVSAKELSEPIIKPLVPSFLELSLLSSKKIMDRLNNEISSKNLSILQNTLPKFYSLKLSDLPSTHEMNLIRSKLLKIDGVTKVETFSKTHDKVYKSLNLLKFTSYIFMVLVGFISMLLMSKQIMVWVHEHRERIEIMGLFGAGFWLKSAVLYKTAMISGIIATIIVVAFFYLLPNLSIANDMVSQIGVNIPVINPSDMLTLFVIAFSLGIFIVSIVMKRAK